MGSTIQKTGKVGQTAGPIGNQFCTYNADESGNGHIHMGMDVRQTNCPSRHKGALGGF